jgi:hypothetical protein
MTLRLHSLRLEVAVVHQQVHLFCTLMWIHSHRWVRALAAAQIWQNKQSLPADRLCKFYHSGDMSGFVLVYVIQGFHTVNRACLPYSPVSIVSRNMSRAAKPWWCLNGLRFSAALSACRQWVVVFIYDIPSHMWCHVFSFWLPDSVSALYFLFHLWVFASLLSEVLLPFYTWKDWSASSCSLSWVGIGHCAHFS